VDQLPQDYAEKYAVAGRPAEFDAVKTWIEYINRLLGAAAGVAMVVTLGFAVAVVRRRPSLGLLVLAATVVLGFVAWLGAKVVGTFLAPYAVTLHLLAAYTLLALLLGTREITGRAIQGARPPVDPRTVVTMVGVGAAFFVQWTLGIRTREEVEAWIWNHDLAQSVWAVLGGAYDLHKYTGFVVSASVAFLAWLGWRGRGSDPRLARLTLWCVALVAVQGGLGLILWLGEIPAWAKPLHLAAATGAWSAWAAAVFHSISPGVRPHGV
jgi:cytochrome c oxidase assembly protein subunit 15